MRDFILFNLLILPDSNNKFFSSSIKQKTESIRHTPSPPASFDNSANQMNMALAALQGQLPLAPLLLQNLGEFYSFEQR